MAAGRKYFSSNIGDGRTNVGWPCICHTFKTARRATGRRDRAAFQHRFSDAHSKSQEVSIRRLHTVAHADDSLAPVTRAVAYGDLNLDSQAGAKVFYGRVKNAARDVCAPLADRDLGRAAQYESCDDHAVTTAVADVNKKR